MVKAVILIPTADNDGHPFSRRDWRELEQRLSQLAGGFTREGDVVGQWTGDDGRVYRDRSRRYVVALPSWMALPAFLEAARWTADWFRQEAIYIEVAGIPEVIPRAR